MQAMKKMLSAARGTLPRIRRDREGMVAVLTALMLPMLVGSLAVATDIAYWRLRTINLQTAADTAAIATALEIAQKGCTTQATASSCNKTLLQVGAASEATRNGCGQGCSLSGFNWPYNNGSGANYGAIEVTVQDGSAKRFFSFLYDSSVKQLRARAVAYAATAGGGSTPGGTTTLRGSGCLLALGGPTSIGISNGVYMQNNGAQILPGCEVISNVTGSSSVYVDALAQIQAPTTLAGTAEIRNQGKITGALKVNQTPTPDPYAGKFTLTGSMLGSSYANAGPWQCAGTWTDGYNVQRPEISGNGSATDRTVNASWNAPRVYPGSQDRINGGQFYWDAANATWRYTQNRRADGTYDVYSSDTGNRVNFCRGVTLRNTTVTFDPGTYVLSQDVTFDNVTLIFNNATLVMSANMYNFGFWNSTMVMVSPGPTVSSDLKHGIPGIVWTQTTDNTTPGNPLEIANNVNLRWRGAIYLPTKTFRVQNTGKLIAINGSNQTSGSGMCSHLILRNILLLNQVQLMNDCDVAYGVQPFGTIEGQGWYLEGSGSGGSSGSGSGTGTATRPKISE